MAVNMLADDLHGIPGISPVCSYCRHLQGYRRCTAFRDGIPLAIWLGKDRHQSAHPGDHGVLFEPVPGAKVTTPQVGKSAGVLWPLIDEETAREPQPV